MKTYDGWKSTDNDTDRGSDLDPETCATCDCGSPLEGGRDGLCTDCVREAHEHAADCSDAEFGFDAWALADEVRYQLESERIRAAGGDPDHECAAMHCEECGS